MFCGLICLLWFSDAGAEPGRWADTNDATARALIAMERQWAEQECTRVVVVDTLLADDFLGTSPNGIRYTKAQAIEQAQTSSDPATGCRLDDARVQFFGDGMAIAYGSERFNSKSTQTDAAETRCLIWTDTWLNRKDGWQIVAAQDSWTDCR